MDDKTDSTLDCEWPKGALPWILLGGMVSLGVSSFQDPNVQLIQPFEVIRDVSLMIFRSNTAIKSVFWSAIGIHFLEGIYCGWILKDFKIEWNTKLKWISQTSLLGFPSLILLLKKLENVTKRE